ncbi:hypothetical protein DFJ58DRAFT_657969, partial [Suillus subalutaceus]|uniref:uncharacterized protein n=1 Tax=Suillus subalutaceus TaxID=48586 RepID=UPI001B874DCC
SGTNRGVLSTCAICLGWKSHRIIECKAPKLWDESYDTLCAQIGKVLTMQDGKPVCSDWQCVSGCVEITHDHRHFCSGCSLSSHGAQTCP